MSFKGAVAVVGLGVLGGAGASYATADHFSSRPEAVVFDATGMLADANAQHEAFMSTMPDCPRTVVETVNQSGAVGYYYSEDLARLVISVCGEAEGARESVEAYDASRSAVHRAENQLDEAKDATTFSKKERILSLLMGGYFGGIIAAAMGLGIAARIDSRRLRREIKELESSLQTEPVAS